MVLLSQCEVMSAVGTSVQGPIAVPCQEAE